jgi:hypothetical protein
LFPPLLELLLDDEDELEDELDDELLDDDELLPPTVPKPM